MLQLKYSCITDLIIPLFECEELLTECYKYKINYDRWKSRLSLNRWNELTW